MRIQLGDLYVRVHFSRVDKIALPLLVETSLIDRIVRNIFQKERRIVPIQSRPLAIFQSKRHCSLLDLLAALQT